MENLVDVINKIVSNPDKVTETLKAGNEIYFRYVGNTCFSVKKYLGSDAQIYGDIAFFVYPKWHAGLFELDQSFMLLDEDNDSVGYTVSELPEIRPSLLRLYKMLEEKEMNVDDIFKKVLMS